jgi:hypothetical protein
MEKSGPEPFHSHVADTSKPVRKPPDEDRAELLGHRPARLDQAGRLVGNLDMRWPAAICSGDGRAPSRGRWERLCAPLR